MKIKSPLKKKYLYLFYEKQHQQRHKEVGVTKAKSLEQQNRPQNILQVTRLVDMTDAII